MGVVHFTAFADKKNCSDKEECDAQYIGFNAPLLAAVEFIHYKRFQFNADSGKSMEIW